MLKKLFPVFLILIFFIVSCEEGNPTPPVTEPPQIEYFSVNSTTVYKGDVVKLSWSVKNSESVSIDQNIGAIPASGSIDVTMNDYGKTTFTLTATNSIGTSTLSITVTVNVLITKLWENRYEYDDGSEWPEMTGPQVEDIAVLSNGDLAVIGTAYNCNNSYPLFLRFNNQGNLVWQRLYEKGVNVLVHSIVETPDYGLFIAGRKGYYENYNHRWAFHLIRVTGSGKVMWYKDYINYYGFISDCAVSDDGNFMLTGRVYDENFFSEVYLGKHREKIRLWEKTFTGDDLNYKNISGNKIINTIDGGYVILGTCGDDDSKWPTESLNLLLMKLDKAGNLIWQKIIGGAAAIETKPSAVIQTKDGGYLIAGNSHEAEVENPNWWGYVVKTDSSGTIEWEKKLAYEKSENWREMIQSVISCSDGNFLVIGEDYISSASDSLTEIYLAKISGSGELIWETNYSPDNTKSRRGIWAVETGNDEYIILAQETIGILCDQHTNIWLLKIKIEP